MSDYPRELIDKTRADLEAQATLAGLPEFKWSDAEIVEHLDIFMPGQRIMREAGLAYASGLERLILDAIKGDE